MLDISLVRSFVAFADAGTLVGAANLVHRTPAALSMQMKRLEDQAGQQLLEPRGRQLVLTEAGMDLLPMARELLRNQNEIERHLRGGTEQLTVRLGISTDYVNGFLAWINQTFRAISPESELRVITGGGKVLRKKLEEGELDMVLVSGEERPGEGVFIASERVCWAGTPSGSAWQTSPLPVGLPAHDCVYRRWALESLHRSGVDYRIITTADDSGALATLASEDHLVAALGHALLAQYQDYLAPLEVMPGMPDGGIRMLTRRPGARIDATLRLALRVTDHLPKAE